MRQEVDFKGLSHNPSDNESNDGGLGSVLNLVPEDGALRPVSLEGRLVGTIPASCRIMANHRGNSYRHWILECAEDGSTVYKWMPIPGSDTSPTPSEGGVIALGDFQANDVTCIGNMVCFVGDSETVYALWRNGDYYVISMRDLDYTVRITNNRSERIGEASAVEMGDDFLGLFNVESDGFHPETDSDGVPQVVRRVTVRKDGAARIWSAIDAKLKQRLSVLTGEYLRHIVIGVAAVRLYDGRLVNVSDFFTLLPRGSSTEVTVNRSDRTVRGNTYAHGHQVSVSMPRKSLLGDLVTGVSIFLTRGDMYFDLDKAYEVTLTTGTSSTFSGIFNFDRLSGDKLYEAVDGESFFLMETIGMDKIGTAGGVHYIPSVAVTMHEVTGAEEAMTLSNLRRGDIGGNVCYTYNNRLHIGGVRETVGTPMKPAVIQEWPTPYGSADDGALMGEPVDGTTGDTGALTMDMALSVKCVSGGQSITLNYALESLRYPFGSILEIPYAYASEADVVIRLAEQTGGETQYSYYKKHVQLHQSDSWGCSYYIDFGRYGMRLSQVREYGIGSNNSVYLEGFRDDWEQVSESVFTAAFDLASPAVLQGNPSLLKVSEVENPLVWPSGGTLSVGIGTILAMASNTEDVSDGNYGEYLYVFTDEGVLLLLVDKSNGLYSMSHEISRDVLTDASSVTPMDKGVLFTTSRGLMTAYGKTIRCISDSLRGVPWQMSDLPHAEEFAGGASYLASVTYEDVLTFLDGARMLYDYTNQRVYIFKVGVPYAYVFSLRSSQWGACESRAVDMVGSYCVLEGETEGGEACLQVVTLGGSTNARQHVLLVSRPLSLGGRYIHKTISMAVIRGMLHGRGSGEASRVGCMLWGSNDLWHWHAVMSSQDQCLRGRSGTPYKWWRIGVVGSLGMDETIDGVSFDVRGRMTRRLR